MNELVCVCVCASVRRRREGDRIRDGKTERRAAHAKRTKKTAMKRENKTIEIYKYIYNIQHMLIITFERFLINISYHRD